MQGPVAALPVQDGESLLQLPKKGVQDSHAGASCAEESAEFSLVPGSLSCLQGADWCIYSPSVLQQRSFARED